MPLRPENFNTNNETAIDNSSNKEVFSQEKFQEHLDKQDYSFILDNLEKFQDLNPQEIVFKFIGVGRCDLAFGILDKYKDLNHQEIAFKFIEIGRNNIEIGRNNKDILYHLSRIIDLNQEIAFKLIDSKLGNLVANNLDKFQGLNHQEIALKLIEAGWGGVVISNLDKFQGLNHQEIASKIIEAGGSLNVAHDLDKFKGLNHQEVAVKIIEAGKGNEVANYLDKFQGLNHQEIALKIIEAGKGESVVFQLEKFKGLNYQEIAAKLVEVGLGTNVANNLNKFQGLSQEIALKLIEAGEGESVVHNLDKFENLNYQEIAFKLIDSKLGNLVAENLDKFQGLNHQEIALKLIEAEYGNSVINNLDKFENINHQEIALKLIEAGDGWFFTENIDKFQGLNYQEIALKLIEAGEGGPVADNINKFQGLNKETAFGLLSLGLDIKSLDSESFILTDSDRQEINQYIEKCHNNYLRLNEGEDLRSDEIQTDKLSEDNYQVLVEKFKNNIPEWRDLDNVFIPFTAGANEFGYRKMFRYLNRTDITRHDQLYTFDKVIKLYKDSSLSSDEFFSNILEQVNKDDSNYEDVGTAYHKLNVIANSGLDVENVLNEAKKHSYGIESLGSLSSVAEVFGSWKNLKKFYDVSQILKQGDILENLDNLKKENKEELYNYVKKLMFHPNVDTQAVMMFWQNPGQFLNIGEIHGTEAHKLKKPANYIEIPNLDLTAENLRDALVEGALDKIQDFQALEIEYKVRQKNKFDELSLVELVSKALGKKREGIKGEANNPDGLFKTLNDIFKKNGLQLLDFLKLNNSQEISEYFKENQEIEVEIRNELFNSESGFKAEDEEFQIFKAKINKKSDPDGVIAGNDTVNCMSFGTGKNNVYTFNPGCALFTLQRKKQEDEWRTVAESVLTKDKDIKKNITEILGKVSERNSKLADLVDKDVLIKQPSIITCDNIEVTPTFSNQENDKIIETIYRDFFREYVNHYGSAESLDPSRVIIGMGYNDSLNNLPRVNNTFIPEAPLGYSDNLGGQSLVIDLDKNSPCVVLNKNIVEGEVKKMVDSSRLPRGVDKLTYKDTLAVSYIEGKAYYDNESLMEYMHNMENGLIAKDINNAHKNRENLSLKYTGDDQAVHGYMVAYEGRKNDESIIYVEDLASDGHARAGGSLIKGFLGEYKKHYLDKGILTPIYAEFREQTSFQILNKQLDNFSEEIGRELILDSIGDYQVGGDTMHKIMIRIGEKN